MNDKELLDLLAGDAPAPSADYSLTTLKRARRVRLGRQLMIGGAGVMVLVIAVLATSILRPSPSLQPSAPESVQGGLVFYDWAGAEHRAAVHGILEQTPGVSDIALQSKAEALAQVREDLKDHPDVLAYTTEESMSAGYLFKVAPAVDRVALAASLRLPGVIDVVLPVRPSYVPTPRPSHLGFTVTGEADIYAQLILAVVNEVSYGTETVYLVDHYCDGVVVIAKPCNPQSMPTEMREDLSELFGNTFGVIEMVNETGALFDKNGAVRGDGVIVALGRFPDRKAGHGEVHLSVTRARDNGRGLRFEVHWDAATHQWKIDRRMDGWIS